MDISLLPISKFVGVNGLKEVTDPITFERGNIPTAGGLLSTEIFGSTISDRKLTFGYIDLKGYYLTPYIYKTLKRLDRNVELLVRGSAKFVVSDKGELIEDPEKGDHGIAYLYKIWDKLKWKKNDSTMRNERVDLVTKHPKNIIFIRHFIVKPPYYRDVNLNTSASDKVAHHEINDLYSRLIRLAQSTGGFDFQLVNTTSRLQDTLVEIYDLEKSRLEKKEGLIRKSLLGKSIDHGARLVITAPDFPSGDFGENPVNMFNSGIPLATCCSAFSPFIVTWVANFFRREFEIYGGMYPVYRKGKDGTPELVDRVVIKDPASHFNDDYVSTMVDRFVNSPMDRFDRIEIPTDDKRYKGRLFMMFTPKNDKSTDSSPLSNRFLTWTDVLYQAAVDVTSNKYTWITRYPLLDHFGMFTTKVHVLSTVKTTPMFVADRSYSHYPVVDLTMSPADIMTYFQDTVQLANVYLAGLDGDYDGDQVTVKGVFSQEANAECERIMKSPSNFLSIVGTNMRKTTNEGIQALYHLTKE